MIDEIVGTDMYPNRSEVVRDATRWFVLRKSCLKECPLEKKE